MEVVNKVSPINDESNKKKSGYYICDNLSLFYYRYVFYEVKFRKTPITKVMIKEEIEQINLTGLKCYKFVFISRSGFEIKPTDNIEFINLKELFYIFGNYINISSCY